MAEPAIASRSSPRQCGLPEAPRSSLIPVPELRLPEPFYARDEHLGIDLPGAHALFTTRRGGFSAGPYASLNLGRLTDDRPEAVQRNRAKVQAEVGVPPAHIRQVHGTHVRRISALPAEGVAPLPDEGVGLPEADGLATPLRVVAPMVLTADCLPIAIAGRGAVTMVHAGWRGLSAGIVAQGVRAVRELGVAGPLEAAIGPGAGVCCYEVGEEVHRAFAGSDHHVRRGRRLDLKAIAREQLERAGVDRVHDAGLCTICSPESLFFSHRRDRGVTGRQAGIAWLS
ncbi:MAG: laccase domain-containing protein [Solirubrobacterales bacterium]|nr:laccase domain-containing protein [Solirubrobacterales bacterium]